MVNFMDLNQLKGYDSCSTKASLMTLDVEHITVLYIYFKFMKIV